MTQNRSELLQQLKLDKQKNGPAPRTTSSWFFAAALGAAVGALACFGVLHLIAPAPEVATASAAPTPTLVMPAKSEATVSRQEKILDASGYITARQIATVSAEVMGLLLSVDVEEGMRVEQGQVLAQIDDSIARINLHLAEAQTATQAARVQSLRVDLKEAQRELVRLQDLGVAGNYASQAQLTQAQTAVDRLQANILGAEADFRAAELQVDRQQSLLEDHVIRAPFSGVVTTKNAQAGEIVSPSSAGGGFTRTGICTIVDMNSLEIQVDVNEAFIGRVVPSQTVNAVLDAYPQWSIPAKVIAVIPTADRAKATVRVRIRIEEKDPRILPDMGVKVSFLAAEKNG